MYPIDLSGKKGIVFGVANDRSIAWAISKVLSDAGAETVIVRFASFDQDGQLNDFLSKIAPALI